MGVDFRDNEGDLRVHPPGAGIVDDDGAGCGGGRAESQGTVAAGGEQGDIDAGKGVFAEELHGDLPAFKGELLADGAFRGEKPQLSDRKIPSCQNVQHGATDCSGGPGNCDIVQPARFTHRSILKNKKIPGWRVDKKGPDLFRPENQKIHYISPSGLLA